MAIAERHFLWTLGTSTGQSTTVITLQTVREHTWHCQTDGSATASLEVRVSRTSTGPWVTIGSSQVLDAAAAVVLGFTGPYLFAAPRLISINSTANRVFVEVLGN